MGAPTMPPAPQAAKLWTGTDRRPAAPVLTELAFFHLLATELLASPNVEEAEVSLLARVREATGAHTAALVSVHHSRLRCRLEAIDPAPAGGMPAEREVHLDTPPMPLLVSQAVPTILDAGTPRLPWLPAVREPGIHRAHHGKLQEMLRPALDRCTGVEKNRWTAARRNRCRQGRAIDSRDHAECSMSRDDRGTSVPGADERRRLAFRHEIGGNAHRRTRLPPHRRHRRLGHLDDVWSIHNLDTERLPVGVRTQRPLDPGALADECDPGVEVTRRRHCAVDHDRRRMVTAHSVNGNTDRQCPASFYSSSTARTGREL